MNAHPTAIIHPKARLASSVTVGAYTVIGEEVELDDDCEVMAHAVLGGPLQMGRRNRIYPFASIGLDPQDLKFQGEKTRLEVGDANIFREFVTIHRGTSAGGGVTRIGNHNLIMAYAHVAHDCQLGNHIIMVNGAALAGHVEIGDHATVGALCAVQQFTRIGAYSFLGANTIVNQDVLPYAKTTAPRPVEVLGANGIGLERRGVSREEISQIDEALRLLCRSGLNTSQALEAIESRGFGSPHVQALVEFVRSSGQGVLKGSGRKQKRRGAAASPTQ
jgi:UDP-N-acetylglucosamine acyltransferase